MARDAFAGSLHGLAVLHRRVDLALVDISQSGCLVETRQRLDPGAVATIEIEVGQVRYSDLVRIVRCQPIAGTGDLYHLGLAFLWSDTPGARALRRLAVDGVPLSAEPDRTGLRWSAGS